MAGRLKNNWETGKKSRFSVLPNTNNFPFMVWLLTQNIKLKRKSRYFTAGLINVKSASDIADSLPLPIVTPQKTPYLSKFTHKQNTKTTCSSSVGPELPAWWRDAALIWACLLLAVTASAVWACLKHQRVFHVFYQAVVLFNVFWFPPHDLATNTLWVLLDLCGCFFPKK